MYQGLSKTHQQALPEVRRKSHCQGWATLHPLVLLTRGASKNPKTIEVIASAVDCQLEPGVKSPLLNTSHTLVARQNSQAGIKFGASFLLASFYHATKCSVNCWGHNCHQQSFSDMDPASYTTDWQSRMCHW